MPTLPPCGPLDEITLGIPYLAIGHGIECGTSKQGTTWRALRAATVIRAVSAFTRDRMSSVLRLRRCDRNFAKYV